MILSWPRFTARYRSYAPALILGGLTLLALVIRLVALGDKPMHHDESEDAWGAWRLFRGLGYHYDPAFHGPLRFFLLAGAYQLLGATDVAARLVPALFGTAIVPLPYLLRRQIGTVAALAAAALLCVSPSFVYFSRFAREDIYVACITLAILAAVFRFIDRPRRWHPALVLGLLAASFATKETTFITVFVAGTFVVVWLLWDRYRPPASGRRLVDLATSLGLDSWLWGGTAFLVVFTALFTNFLTWPAGLPDGAVGGIVYWLSQQPVHRGDQPWFYYLVLISGYEWPEVLLGIVGVVAVLRRPTIFRVFVLWAFICSLAVYSWASERFPWLVLHPLLPLILLAAIGGQWLWDRRRRLLPAAGLAASALGIAYLVVAGFGAALLRPADPSEMLVYTQSSVDVPPITQELARMDESQRRSGGAPLGVDIDSAYGAAWPWAWYLRDYQRAGYVDMSLPGYSPTAQVLLVTDLNHGSLAPKLGRYTGRRFQLRVWWLPEFKRAGVTDWAQWLAWRRPWSPKGSFDEWILVRDDVGQGR